MRTYHKECFRFFHFSILLIIHIWIAEDCLYATDNCNISLLLIIYFIQTLILQVITIILMINLAIDIENDNNIRLKM